MKRSGAGDKGDDDTTTIASAAAWAVLLSTWTASNRVVFALNHPHPEDEKKSASAAAIVIDTSVDASSTIADLIHSFKLSQERSTQIATARRLLIQCEAERNGDYAAIGSLTRAKSSTSTGTRCTLSLEVQVSSSEIFTRATFDATVIDEERMRRVLKQFEHILHQMTAAEASNMSTLRVKQVEVFSPQDAQEMAPWTDLSTSTSDTLDTCAHRLIEQRAKQQPDAPAVSAWDAQFTYEELDGLSNRLALHLSGLGVRPDVMVPFCFEKSAWAVVSMLAILKAGGACVGLDGNHPKTRLSKIIQDCGSQIILTSRQCQGLFSGPGLTIIPVDEAFVRSLPSSPSSPSTSVSSSHAAYVTFTSGTTGDPKGIIIEHRSICWSGATQGPTLRLRSSSRVLQFAAYSFDISNGDILNTLMNGGCICVPSEDERSNDLAGFINRTGVNWACLTPSAASILDPSAVSTLETLVLCGEPIKQEVVRLWADAVYLVDAYGPAETTILCTSNPGVKPTTSSANLGGNMGATCWIVNPSDHNQLQPLGCAGEILIEGPLVSRGYLNDAQKTSLSFIENPRWTTRLSSGGTRRFYKSGDLGYFNHDGTLTFVGRKDSQVKIRGQRVELHEIEHHVRTALPPSAGPVVADVVSLASREVVAAFICLEDQIEEEVDDFRRIPESTKTALATTIEGVPAKLVDLLPAHMIPSIFFPLKTLPLNRSGKTDRAKLREMTSVLTSEDIVGSHTLRPSTTEPSTELEKQLRDHWASALKLEARAISADDSFVRLGGDSLMAMKLVAACRQEGIPLQVAKVLSDVTLVELAASLQPEIASSHHNQQSEGEIPPFSLLDKSISVQAVIEATLASCTDIEDAIMIQDAYPCTALQEGLMALSYKQHGSYIGQEVTELPEDIDLVRFQRAWSQTIEACDILRTRLVHAELDTLCQVVVTTPGPWVEKKLKSSDMLQQFQNSERSATMSLGQPLSRYAVVSDVSTGKRYFVWTIHHALYDAWSMPIVKDMVEKAYAGVAIEYPPSFNHFIKEVRKLEGEASEQFWRQYLDACEVPPFPVTSTPAYLPDARTTVDSSFQIPRRRDAAYYTLPTVLRAAMATLVGCYTDSDDVVFGVTLWGRNVSIPDITSLVGPTIVTVPVRTRWSGETTLGDILASVQQQGVEMIPHEQLGLQNIQRLGQGAHNACQFQSLVNIRTLPDDDGATDDHAIFPTGNVLGGEMGSYGTYAFVLYCVITPANEVLVRAAYDEKLLDREQVTRYMRQFEHLVLQFCTLDHSTRMGDGVVASINEDDWAEVQRWNSSRLESADNSFGALFKEQVILRPTARAVRGWDGDLSYEELEDLSTRLAVQLVEKAGVKPSDFVPLCFEKSVWSLVAMLAVIKAGACTVPLDPFHPKQRLDVIIAAVEAKTVLCSKQYASIFHDVCDKVIVIDGESCKSYPPPQQEHDFLSLSSANSALYTLFTSGSTGVPKGVVTEHGAFLSSAIAYAKGFELSQKSQVLLYSSYSFDISILEMLTPLLLGACVCVVSDNDRLHNLGAAMETLGVNAAFLTPTVARTIDPQSVPSLEILALGGEPVDRRDIAQWTSSVIHFFEWYGPTEASVISSGFAGHSLTSRLGNIGRPFNAKYWVTSAQDPNKLAPIGAVGELLIEGPILARCYLGDPVKTENAFVKSLSWAGNTQRRFYRTGDLVRYDAAGNVLFLGRSDTQVKLRGQRMDLGEIQDGVLRSAPDVQSAVVDIVRIGQQEPTLVAFVCLENEDAGQDDKYLMPSNPKREAFLSSLNNIEARLLSLLPRYMVPSLFVPLSRVPVTASRKADRKMLRNLVAALSSQGLAEYRTPVAAGRAPSTGAEKQLQELWAGVLSIGAGDISAESSFLAIGGDSIRAIRLVAACRARGLELSIPQIFQCPKLEDMALLLAGKVEGGNKAVENAAAAVNGHDSEPKPLSMFNNSTNQAASTQTSALEEVLTQCNLPQKELVEDVYPTAPLQEGLMALSIKEPDSYKAQSVIDLTSAGIDVDKFRAAWDRLVEMAPILRTRICNTKSKGSLQVVCKEPVEWHTSDSLSSYLEQDRSRQMAFGERLARYAIVRDSAAHCHFVWTVHHALYDAWTIRLILNHVHTIYAGQEIERPVPFSKYVKYVTESNEAAGGAASEQFWRAQLKDATLSEFPPLPSPTYNPKPDTITHHGFDLPHGAQPQGEITRSIIALAAWALVIGRYTGSGDVTFGTILSGRYAPIAGIERVLGPTINTVPIHRKIDPDQTVGQYLGAVQKQAISMIPHEILGLRRIQNLDDGFHEACQFRSLLVIQPEGLDDEDAEKQEEWLSQFTSPPGELDFAGYPLALDCTMTKTGIKIAATHDSNVINAAQMTDVLHQFAHAFTQLSFPDAPDTKLGSLEAASANDIQQISNWNRTSFPSVDTSMDQMFSESARLAPQSTAVHAWDGDLTYAELDNLSNSLAHRLVNLGVGRETPVPLCFHKTRWYLVAMIATLKAGGTFVPMDPAQPPARLESILQQTQAKMVLCSPSNAALLRESSCDKVVVLGDEETSQLVNNPVDGFKPRHKRPQDAAYIIFTSGSTGEPKGCVVSHQANCTHLTAHAKNVAGSAVRTLQFSSYSFDMSLLEIFTTLVAGGCVCIPSDADRLGNIEGVISDMQINWACLTPSVARLINPATVPSLKTLWIGGEGISQDDLRPWLGRVHLVQMYGPTECAVVSSLAEIKETTQSNDIGRPLMSNYWIVDAENHHTLLPVGAVGELLIDGPVLARGYLNDAAKTAAAFIEDTPRWLQLVKAGDQQPRRMYKTGDLVRYRTDGSVLYMGRKESDRQVKIRGLRVQLDEVEHHLRKALLRHEQEAVAELAHVEGKPMLVAFLADTRSNEAAAAQGRSSDEDLFDVDAATKSRLTSTMSAVESDLAAVMHSSILPSAYIPVRCIPMSSTGKTDRARLRRFVSGLSLGQLNTVKVKLVQSHVEPSTSMERRLQEIWAAVLGVEQRTISAVDSFFGIGADSITAIRLTGECRSQGIALLPRDIFRNPILRDMASVATLVNPDETDAVNGERDDGETAHFSLLGQMSMHQHAAMECGVAQDSIEDIYPCTALQEGMMATSVRIPGAYAAQGLAELSSDVDLARLRGAWEKVVELNPILRTRLIHPPSQSDGQFVQVVVRESISWQYAESLGNYTAQDSHKTMGLGRPLARYALVDDKATQKRYFVWTVHHALYDGWSLSLIFKAVNDAYYQKHDTAKETTKDFKSYVKYLGNSSSLEAAETFWKSSLQDATPSSFPPVISSESHRPQPDSTLRHTIQITPTGERGASSSFTLPTIVRAAWTILISRYTDSPDVCFGTVVLGRTAPLPGIEKIAGPTASTVPVRTMVNPDLSVLEFLREVQNHAAEMMPYESFGIQRIQRLSQGARAACRFQNLLVVQPEPADTSNLVCPVKVEAAGDVLDNVRDTYAMGVECSLGEQSIECNTAYDSKIIGQKQTERIMSQFGHLIQQLLRASETSVVGELDLIGSSGRKEIETWNADTPKLEGSKLCLDEMFRASVQRQGAKLAIEAWDGNLSYDELDQATNRLAQHLIDAGVGPEIKVPLCFQKSRWMVVAMVSVVKAGGAIVPLDPNHPRDRLEYIMNAVDADIVLCSADQAEWISQCKNKTAIAVDDSFGPKSDQEAVSGRTALSNALYVVFTSGSSGQPKGCVMEHRAFCSMVPHLERAALFGPSVRILQLASYSFGAAIAEMFATLIYGGSLCVVPAEARARLPLVLKEMDINYMFMTPSFSRMLPPQMIATVKTLIFGAESLTSSDLEKWAPHVNIVQGYGQTECATIMSCHPNMTVDAHPRNVGSPMGSRFWIVDASNPNVLAPLGATGEVLIEGPILAREYLNDPEKTAAAFIKAPYWRNDFPNLGTCERLYRTGDLARFDDDGTLLFMGRKDNQVKLRGQRIELGEIEHHLQRAMPGAKGIVVELFEKPSSDGEIHSALVAFVALGPDVASNDLSKIDPKAMEALQALTAGSASHLSRFLPSYMIPSVYLPLGAIPMTASAKVDRRGLRTTLANMSIDDVGSYSLSKAAKREPSTAEEKLLQKHWSKVLRVDVDSIGADDDFMQVGGDSLSAIKLVSLCQSEGLTLSVADIFENPTLSKMATVLKSAPSTSQTHDFDRFSTIQNSTEDEILSDMIKHGIIDRKDQVEDALEATYMQSVFVASALRDPQSKANYISLDFASALDKARLEAACHALVARHQILRTVFFAHRQQLLQVVLRSLPEVFAHYQNNGDESLETFAAKKIEEDNVNDRAALGRSFLRFMFFDGGAGGCRLTIRINHSQFDGISFPLLLEDLASLYAGTASDVSRWPGFSSFSYTAHEMHEAGAVDFYEGLLDGASMTEIASHKTLPFDHHPADQLLMRRVPRVEFPGRGLTFAVVLKAAWAKVLAAVTGQADVVFGYLVSGRSLPMAQIEDVVGPCINTTPVRVNTQEPTTVLELLEGVRDQNLQGMPFETYPYDKIVSNCTQWPSGTRLSTLLECQIAAVEPGTVPLGEGLKCFLSATNPRSDLADLVVDAMPSGSGGDGAKDIMRVQFLYSAQRVSTSLVAKMADLLCSYLDQIHHQNELDQPLSTLAPALDPVASDSKPVVNGSTDSNNAKDAKKGVVDASKTAAVTPDVEKVWREVLDDVTMNPQTPFYSIWSSPIAAAQFAVQYNKLGYQVDMEDIVAHATMEQQSGLLSRGNV